MKIGLMGALPEELNEVIQRSAGLVDRKGGREFWPGQWHGQNFVAALSGVGKVAAASTAALMIERHGVDVMLFTGVAGGVGPGVAVADAVVATHYLQHDMDSSPLFPRHVVPSSGLSRYPTDVQWSQRLAHAAQQALKNLQVQWPSGWFSHDLRRNQVHQGLIISGDRFVSTTAECQALQTELPEALAVEMEGAAVAQVCLDHGVPFAAVRLISDRADDSAHPDFLRLVQDLAAPFSAHLMNHLLKGLGSKQLGSDPH
jgi:adenosylhomocysteine nucleosidase